MADMAADYDDSPRPARRTMAAAAGAVCAAALLWGIASWGYGLLTRDAGQIPFLRAEEGPMKVLPDDPGGLKLARADMAVTRMISGAEPAEETLAPAPDMPTEEDLPIPHLSEVASEPAARALAPEAESENPIDAAVARVLAEQPAPAPIAADPNSHAPAAAPLVPVRPSPSAAAQPAPAPQPQTASLASGDVAIQLGAFNTAEIADAQWRRHLARNEDLLQSYAHAVTTVESGGRTLYRLRVGPMPDRDRAADLCAALKARGDACIVATVR